MVDLSQYEAIIFDMDGTLIDSMGLHLDAWKSACEKFDYPFDREYMYSLGGVPTVKTVELLNQKFQKSHNPQNVADHKRHVWGELGILPPLIEDTISVFRHYRPLKSIGIGTGAERSHAERVLMQHGLLTEIDTLVTATDVEFGKPHPETFLTAAKNMGADPSRCVVFEDTEIGESAAIAAGMDCILVKDGRLV